MGDSVTAFAPASISNLNCGFDVLGGALAEPGDRVTARRTDRPGVHLAGVEGDDGRLPREPEANTASVAVRALFQEMTLRGAAVGAEVGVELYLAKGLPLASGLGSSAASAVAAVVAVDALLGLEQPRSALLAAAVEGERVACGAGHADNVAPSLHGGLVLVRSTEPLDVVDLAVPAELRVVLLHPELEIATREARNMLPRALPLSTAVAQWGNVGALVAALYREDWELLSRALVDEVAEPVRSKLIPGFDQVRLAARQGGALGMGLSGSGPTLFAFCRGDQVAGRVAEAMAETFRREAGTACRTWTSTLAEGARVVS